MFLGDVGSENPGCTLNPGFSVYRYTLVFYGQ